jgi:hypothetical protein
MGSCYSASFIEGLEKENRTIIVSAGKNEESQHGLRFGSNVYMGDFFLASFFRAVLKNETLKDCFNHASNMTQKWTSAQTPVFFGADFGIGISPRHKYSQIIDLPDFITIEPNVNSWDLLAGVDEMTVDRMWIDIKKPDGSKQMTRVMCEEEKYVGKRLFKAQDTFMDSGIYDIYFVVEDKLSKEDFSFISSVKHMTLLKIPETANQPPENFKLLYPKEKEKISTTDWFVWENAKDPENEQVFYTLYISEDQDFNEPSLRIKGLKVPYYKLTAEQALNDRTEYYWKIQAMDISGGINESNTLSFTTNNENCDLPVWVQLNFHDIIRNESVDSSHCPMTICVDQNCFFNPPGCLLKKNNKYDLMVKAEGYHLTSTEITIGTSTISQNYLINLLPRFTFAELIRSLEYFVGYTKPSPQQKKHADICNNGMIDLNDLQLIFLLQSMDNQNDFSVTEINRICEQSND